MTEAVVAAPIAVPQAEIDLLRRKLDLVRWPDRETCSGWEQGVRALMRGEGLLRAENRPDVPEFRPLARDLRE